MQYDQIRWLPDGDDPSIIVETDRLVAKVIDNTGLRDPESELYLDVSKVFGSFTHHLGYHGIRTLYDKTERRNIVAPFIGILNWQMATMDGVEADPVDDRARFGIPRGWPLKLSRDGDSAVLEMDPLPSMQVGYRLSIQPASDTPDALAPPDALDFSIRFTFHRTDHTEAPRNFYASWACYLAGYDSVEMHYPAQCLGNPSSGASPFAWKSIGEKPDIVIGETVGYEHDQTAFVPEDCALPLAYVRIGERAITLMFDDPTVRPFVVNSGGHTFSSSVQNPAFDFSWQCGDYAVGEPVGFDGRLIYAPFEDEDDIMDRYETWQQRR
jgi:hypothetical protein